jgi:hypothetical protein
MPKLLVMLLDATDDATRLADATVDGASSVRFTEVDLRSNTPHGPIAGRRYRQLESREGIKDYDGLVLVAANPSSPGLVAFIEDLKPFASRGVYANLVIGVTTSQPEPAANAVAPLGGIVITSADATEPMHVAKHLAARVARVGAWVRHSLDHEHHERGEHHHPDNDHHHEHEAEETKRLGKILRSPLP